MTVYLEAARRVVFVLATGGADDDGHRRRRVRHPVDSMDVSFEAKYSFLRLVNSFLLPPLSLLEPAADALRSAMSVQRQDSCVVTCPADVPALAWTHRHEIFPSFRMRPGGNVLLRLGVSGPVEQAADRTMPAGRRGDPQNVRRSDVTMPDDLGPQRRRTRRPGGQCVRPRLSLAHSKQCKPDHALTVTQERDLSTFGGSWCVSAPANPPCAGQCSTTTRPLSVANNRLNSSC
jgi:hypothetical protein